MDIFRIISAFKGKTDRYEESFDCSKDLKKALEFIRGWQGKGLYRAGKLRVARDVNNGTWHLIEMQVQARQPGTGIVVNVLETITYSVFFYKNVVSRVSIDLKAVAPKKTFDDFKKAFLAGVPDIEAEPAPAPVAEEKIDLSGASMVDALDLFDKCVKEFGANVSAQAFAKIKAIATEINNKIEELPAKDRAGYMTAMSKISAFISAIDMQFRSSPASVASFAGTYVSQMRAEIAQMISLAS